LPRVISVLVWILFLFHCVGLGSFTQKYNQNKHRRI
jgi:hypothetical protein